MSIYWRFYVHLQEGCLSTYSRFNIHQQGFQLSTDRTSTSSLRERRRPHLYNKQGNFYLHLREVLYLPTEGSISTCVFRYCQAQWDGYSLPSQNQAVGGWLCRLLEIFDCLLSKTPIVFSCIRESLTLLYSSITLHFGIFLDKADSKCPHRPRSRRVQSGGRDLMTTSSGGRYAGTWWRWG